MKRPMIAFFDFACCEGCQLQLANMGEDLIDILDAVEVVEFREIMSETWEGQIDVAVVEGSITTAHAAERLQRIRERAGILIAYGSCATIGGVNGMKNAFDLQEIRQRVYGTEAKFFPTEKTRSLQQVVPVDYFVHGCPVYLPELRSVLKAALQGIPYYVPDYPVCVECKLNENVCMFERGITCLGPVTRAGCNSWCVSNGNTCYGCRGMLSNPNEKGARDVLSQYNIPLELITKRMTMYNQCREQGGDE